MCARQTAHIYPVLHAFPHVHSVVLCVSPVSSGVAQVVIETTAKRYINCANKLEKMKDLRCKMVRERMHNLLQRYQMSLVEMPRETKEKDTEGGSEYISLQELQEKEPPVPENWPPTFQAQNNECRIA